MNALASAPGGPRATLRFFDRESARSYLAPFSREATNIATIRRFLAQDGGRSQVLALRDDAVLTIFAGELASGRARIVTGNAIERVGGRADLTDEKFESEPEEISSEPKTWIEIELLDTEGAPVRGEPYSITLPDERVIEGKLDGRGRAYVAGLDPGTCTVRFPNLDGDAVAVLPQAAKGAARTRDRTPASSSSEKTWVEIELVDEEGTPIANEPYWLKLPNGVIRRGRLNESGFAHVGDLDPGTCYVRFPDRDEGAWEALPPPEAPAPADLEAEAQAQTLRAAARDGVPFCEECERRAQARASA